MIWDIVDRAYIISLPSRLDRRREMTGELEAVGMANDDGVRFFDAIRPDDAGGFPSIGARGCFLSHLGVLKEAEADGLDAVAIFEDDIEFADDFTAREALFSKALADKDWSIFYGGWDLDPYTAFEPGEGVLTQLAPDVAVRCTHFICFRGRAIAGARAFLEELLTRPPGDPKGGPMHVDGAYARFKSTSPAMQCFAASTPLAGQRASRSDIAPLKWYDKTPGLSLIVNGLRRLRSKR